MSLIKIQLSAVFLSLLQFSAESACPACSNMALSDCTAFDLAACVDQYKTLDLSESALTGKLPSFVFTAESLDVQTWFVLGTLCVLRLFVCLCHCISTSFVATSYLNTFHAQELGK